MKKITIILLAAMCFVACREDDDLREITEELYEITSYTENGITATVYSDREELVVGYNLLTVTLESESAEVEGQSVTVSPVMDMMTMTHSCPVELISGTVTNGTVEVAVVFVMASGDMGSWTVAFEAGEHTVTVPVTVNAPEYAQLVSLVSEADGVAYYIALIDPVDPEVGSNDLEIAVYKRESMMSWPAVEDLIFEMEPWMLSMGHSSPNNVAPVNTENGHYLGTVNFTMTGDWQIQLTMMEEDGETVLGEPYFDLYFQ